MPYNPRKPLECSVCGKPAIARKLCPKHYNQAKARGDIDKHAKLGPEDVFESRYKVKDSGCWEWTGSLNDSGYGLILIAGKQVRAHRYSFERVKGKIPRGKVLMHSCDNRPCINPNHLSIGTRLLNNRDAASKRRFPMGEKHWSAVLSNEQVEVIREVAGHATQQQLASDFNVTPSTISRILSGKRRAR